MNKQEIGKYGERLAEIYMKRKGYIIIARNYSKKFGEIDLVAKSTDSTIVILEVKTIVGESGNIRPEDHLTLRKLKILQRIGQFYINDNPAIVNEVAGWRIDLIAVWLRKNTRGSWAANVRHYKNI